MAAKTYAMSLSVSMMDNAVAVAVLKYSPKVTAVAQLCLSETTVLEP